MKTPSSIVVLLFSFSFSVAAQTAITNDTEAAQWQRIYKRMNAEMGITNAEEMMKIPIIRATVVHPAFGIAWDELPPPTLTNSSAMAGVDTFIATNGWNMLTNTFEEFGRVKNLQRIRGLPWREIQDRDFPAVTHNGILYIYFKGWHHNDSGVAFNPKTNAFPSRILGFKPLANHWYAWAQSDDGMPMMQVYEGQKIAEPSAPANGAPRRR